MLGLHIAWLYFTLSQFQDLTNAQGLPLGADFITYWAASHLAQSGDPLAAYNASALLVTEHLAAPVNMPHTGWFYPPQFLLLIWPLASLQYATAYLAFSLSSLALFIYAARTICPDRFLIALIAFPAVFLCISSGQNGLITASLAALSLHYLKPRPILAGCLMGLLCIKPQLLLLFPCVLMLTRQWRALSALVISSLVFAALATCAFGWPIWPAFIQGLAEAKTYLETDIPLARMPTVFALIRQAGGNLALAYTGHAIVASIGIVALLAIWTRTTSLQLRGSALVAATLLASPYFFDYDLVWYALPMAWLYQLSHRQGWLSGERLILGLAWALVLYVKLALYLLTGKLILVAAPISVALLWLTWRRTQLTQTER